MSKKKKQYAVSIIDSTGDEVDTIDGPFDTWEDAEAEAQQWISDYDQGGDYLEETGEERGDDVDYLIVEL